jgi:hypothetical protein
MKSTFKSNIRATAFNNSYPKPEYFEFGSFNATHPNDLTSDDEVE